MVTYFIRGAYNYNVLTDAGFLENRSSTVMTQGQSESNEEADYSPMKNPKKRPSSNTRKSPNDVFSGFMKLPHMIELEETIFL